MNQEYFTFELASSIHLGVPLANMGAVTQFAMPNICIVPGVASFWYGVVNYKGSLLWVLDSDRLFNLAAANNQRLSKLTAVIVRPESGDSHQQVAIVAQQLKGIIAVEPSSLQPLNNHSPQLQPYCSAVAETDSQSTYLIDATKLLEQLHQQSTPKHALAESASAGDLGQL